MSQPPGPELTSIRSPRVKAARQLSKRALRVRTRSFLAEGPQAVSEALARGGVVTELFLTAAARSRHGGLAAQASRQGAAVHAVSGEVMAELAQTITPQGILAVCRFVDVPLSALTAAEVVAGLRAAGLRVLAADGSSGQSLDRVEPRGVLSEPTAWLFGNEAWGLPADILALADETVAVPIYGQAESLNLAAAAAVCLYASARAQRANEGGGCRTAPATR